MLSFERMHAHLNAKVTTCVCSCAFLTVRSWSSSSKASQSRQINSLSFQHRDRSKVSQAQFLVSDGAAPMSSGMLIFEVLSVYT